MGAAVGAADGPAEGKELGAALGYPLGRSVGFFVDGRSLGILIGRPEGTSLSSSDKLGIDEGLSTGQAPPQSSHLAPASSAVPTKSNGTHTVFATACVNAPSTHIFIPSRPPNFDVHGIILLPGGHVSGQGPQRPPKPIASPTLSLGTHSSTRVNGSSGSSL